jgi:uncharacterized protein YecE (DUF72 family)
VNLERLSEFLAALPRKHRYVFELREPSWITQPVLDLLKRHRAAFCIYEIAGYHSPLHVTADFAYVRLHGPTANKYAGSYSDLQLQSWADWIDEHRNYLSAIYFYFDNDQAGYAAHNALTLRRMVAGKLGQRLAPAA